MQNPRACRPRRCPMSCASVSGATSARRRKHDLVGGFQGRRQRRDGTPHFQRAGDRRVRPALRSAAVPRRCGGRGDGLFRRADRQRLAYLLGRHAPDVRQLPQSQQEPGRARARQYSLAQAGAPRRHARLPAHRARRPRFKHPPGCRAGEAPLGGSQPEGRAGAQHGRLGHVRSPAMSVKIDLNHKIHVLTKKEELDGVRVPGKVVVVLDILFATTTMVTALAHGATEVIPVLDEAAARAESERYRDCVLAGELHAETIAGFAHPAPLALLKHGIRGKTVVYSTTNGTVTMTRAAGAARVMVTVPLVVEYTTVLPRMPCLSSASGAGCANPAMVSACSSPASTQSLYRSLSARAAASSSTGMTSVAPCASAATIVVVANRISSTTTTLPGTRTPSSSSFLVST